VSVAAWVDEIPISAEEVEARLARLRASDRAGSLPVAGSREGRQLRRWITQVVVVERLCAQLPELDAASSDLTPGGTRVESLDAASSGGPGSWRRIKHADPAPSRGAGTVGPLTSADREASHEAGAWPRLSERAGTWAPLSRADAAALGSIVAAAWTNDPAVPRAAALVTSDVSIPPERMQRATELSATDDDGAAWSSDELLTSARLEAFARWLARETHERVRLETGYEHPGDASQPDNLHEH
jgi:[acyl-carrier-protein] S-malonyltransferase